MISFRSLNADEVEARIGSISKSGKSLTLLLYKDARCDMRLLDDAVGAENWQCSYEVIGGALFCTVSIKTDSGEWVGKCDCGTESNMEAKKGEASDAFKRACFRWGIGRELYTAPEIRVPESLCEIFKNDKGNFVCYDKFRVKAMEVEQGRITALEVVNAETGQTVFTFPKKAVKRDTAPTMDNLRAEFKRWCARRELTASEAAEILNRKAGKEVDETNLTAGEIKDLIEYMKGE